MTETNSFVTNRIPSTGAGLRKTYEESIIRHIRNCNFGLSYKNHIFLSQEDGSIIWASTTDEKEKCLHDYNILISNPDRYKRVALIGLLPDSDGGVFIEVIDPAILHMHLVQEAEYAKELLETKKLGL